MRHILMTAAALTLLSATAFAHPEHSESDKDTPETEFTLPSKAEMQDILDQMPDFNGILGDFKDMAEDEDIQNRLENIGESFVQKLDESGALETQKNGLPDINKAIEVMMFAFTDDDIAGELVDTMTEVQDIVEKHMPEDTPKRNVRRIEKKKVKRID